LTATFYLWNDDLNIWEVNAANTAPFVGFLTVDGNGHTQDGTGFAAGLAGRISVHQASSTLVQ
jgi:hypothetical protein